MRDCAVDDAPFSSAEPLSLVPQESTTASGVSRTRNPISRPASLECGIVPKSTADWSAKLHPVFFDIAALMRVFERRFREVTTRREQQIRTVPETDIEARRKIDVPAKAKLDKLLEWCTTQLAVINERHPNMPFDPRADAYLYPAADEPDAADPFTRYLHWMRHRRSLTMTLRDYARGSLDAVSEMSRTAQDRLRVLVRREKIKPFQGDEVHRQFLRLIIMFQREPLTAQERADCADEYCGCGKTEHDVDALRKQYAWLTNDLDAAYAALQRPPDPSAGEIK